jgi:hypothetical protein
VTAGNTLATADNAAASIKTYNITPGIYDYYITGFGASDKLVCGGTTTSVVNTSGADGAIEVQCTGSGLTARILLSGVALASDAAVFNKASFIATFGAGALAP